ncbi:hypothetical protein [Candidatus Spongiihabitans sp.]|uniref:hypothetical protein n=1 Tax=Candidatus Spongiihabitans sp. TaxID=3101308 RepID=UPI003C7DE9C5
MTTEESQLFMTFGGYLLNMISAIIGGLIAIAGGYMTIRVSHKLNRKSSKADLKKKKLEQLVTAAYKTLHWLDNNRELRLAGADVKLPKFPIYKTKMLSKLYVPELESEVHRLIIAADAYQNWILEGHRSRLKREKLSDPYLKKFKHVHEELRLSVSNITNEAAEMIENIDNH